MSEQRLMSAVREAKKGKIQAFAEIYEETYQNVYRFICFIVKNEHDAEDVLQDVYIAAFNSIRTLKADDSFFSWLCTIAYRKAIDSYKKTTRKNYREYQKFDIAMLQSERTDIENSIIEQEQSRLIKKAVNKLPNEQRTCAILFYYNNMQVKEIAKILDCSENTVKSRLRLARERLKPVLTEDNEREIRKSANQYTLKKEKANRMLPAILFGCNLDADVRMTGRMQKNTSGKFWKTLFASSAGMTVAATAISFGVLFNAAPQIDQILYNGKEAAMQEEVSVIVSNYNNLEKIQVTGPAGEEISIEAEGCVYSFTTNKNGTYFIKLEGKEGKDDSDSVTIDNIDHTAPVIKKHQYRQGTLTLNVYDELAGVDYTRIQLVSEKGDKKIPDKIERNSGMIEFANPFKKGTLILYDTLGNKSTYNIEKVLAQE